MNAMLAMNKLRAAKAAAEVRQDQLAMEFIAALDTNFVVVKDDSWIVSLEKDCSSFLQMVDQRDSLAADVNAEKEDLTPVTSFFNAVGIFCPQVKAKDYDMAAADEAAAFIAEARQIIQDIIDLDEEVDAETKRAVALGILAPLWAEVKYLQSETNALSEKINAKYEALRDRVLDAYKGKKSSYVFSGSFPAIKTFLKREEARQTEYVQARELYFQTKAAERKAAKAKRQAEAREARRLAAKQVTGNGKQELVTVYSELVNVPVLTFPKVNRDGKKVAYIQLVGQLKKAA